MTTTTDMNVSRRTWVPNDVLTRNRFAMLKLKGIGRWAVFANRCGKYSWATFADDMDYLDKVAEVSVDYQNCSAALISGVLPKDVTLYTVQRAANELDG